MTEEAQSRGQAAVWCEATHKRPGSFDTHHCGRVASSPHRTHVCRGSGCNFSWSDEAAENARQVSEG